ncbi:DNA cytosine methyltransferase [Patescibacteria group bacterium]|nr:DNA cytosine methyltransferase [Patescibacteria group bacterium]
MSNKKPTFIDLFAGAGGLSIGIQQAGFKPLAATDWDHWSCETLRANHKDMLVHEGDITSVDLEEFSKRIGTRTVDLIVGGPPCQGFSRLGKQKKDDPRNQMWREYMRFVAFFKPKVFLMENVPQLLTSDEFPSIKKMAEDLGYEVREKVLHAVEYGVPQKRKRAIIFGSRIGIPNHPQPTHTSADNFNLLNAHLQTWATVKDAIADLPLEPTGKDWHIGRNPTPTSLKRYKSIPAGGNRFDLPLELTPDCWKRKKTGSTDVFGRLEWDKPSLTIRTEFFKPEKGCYLHPEAHRPITIREAARLQTFPDDYVFVGSNVQVAKQIGNAVPCRLALAVGKELFQFLNPSAYSVQNEAVDGLTPLERQLA